MLPLINSFCGLYLLIRFASTELVKLDFTKTTVEQLAQPGGCLDLPLYNDLAHQRYLINLTVGTPPVSFAVTADTGSADLWFPLANSSGCSPNCPPPTYDPSASSTSIDLGYPFNSTYGLTPDLQVTGEYYNDTVHLGSAVIPQMTVATGNIPPEIYEAGIYGLMGLGSRFGEAVYNNPSSPGSGKVSFPTIYDQLKTLGYIKKRLFSIWLNDIAASTGSILFGGIDLSKYTGKLQKVPVVLSRGVFTGWAVNLTSVSLTSSNGTHNLSSTGFPIEVVLDSGSPNMYLPTTVADAVASTLNATTDQGTPYVPCSFRQADGSLHFGFGNGSAPKFEVPYSELIYPFGSPAKVGNVTAPDGTELCYLGLLGTPGPIFLLGDTFIRSLYVVYDADELEISFAPVKQRAKAEGITEM